MRLHFDILKLLHYTVKNKFFIKLFGLDKSIVFLNYHRVVTDDEFYNDARPNDDLVISEKVFEKQIKFIVENFNVISINDIKNINDSKTNKIVITFDDGYSDNLNVASRILDKYKCPAIIYITTSFLDNKKYPWWFKIWDILLKRNTLNIEKKTYVIKDKKSKKKIFKNLSNKLFNLKIEQQKIFFEDISKKNNININLENKNFFLDINQLKLLSDNPLIEIGCHTHLHQNLKILNEKELDYEISESKKILEKTLKKKIKHFSIPFGSSNAYSKETLKNLKKYQFETIVTTKHGMFEKKRLDQIPRIGIGNYDLNEKLYLKCIGLISLLNKIFLR